MTDIIKAHAVKNLCYIAARKMVPKGIVVHSTGANNPYLKRYVDAPAEVGKNTYGNHWNVAKPGGNKVCVHAFIGYDEQRRVRVAEILPLNICCWGVGSGRKGSYNYAPAYIQFEICEDSRKDRAYYQKAFAVAAEYCAMLCRRYGFGTDKIVGHCEAYRLGYGSNHGDPEHWMKLHGETMEDFRKRVAALLKSSEPQKPLPSGETRTVEKGDLVSLAADAVYYSGKAVPAWVRAQNWIVKSAPAGDRVVIDRNEKGDHAICSPVHRRYLTVVKKAQTIPAKAGSACPYRVKVTADCLVIRKGAGADTAAVGKITDHGVYTVVEEKNGAGAIRWGRLKSGAGWIPLDGVKKR